MFGCFWVGGEETPVHEAAVAEVWVVDFFGAPFEDLWDDGGAFARSLEEEFYCGGEEGELDFDGFFVEGREVVLEE